MQTYALQTTGLTMRYHHTLALDGVNLELPQGKIVGLLGPNGSGKTTLIKLTAGLLTPTSGSVCVCGESVGAGTKSLVSYLPDRPYFSKQRKIQELLDFFQDFYADFDRQRAEQMLHALGIALDVRFRTLSKGNQEDPAARDYVLNTIITNYDPTATVLISTHLIADVERILDEFVFLNQGKVVRYGNADETREETGKSLDELFREVFKCLPNC